MSLAVAMVSCDSYSYLWDTWYKKYMEYVHLPAMGYFIGETKAPSFFKALTMGEHPVEKWTDMLMEGIEQIDEEYILVLLDDLIWTKNVFTLFTLGYNFLRDVGGDSFRVLNRTSRSRTEPTGVFIQDKSIDKLMPGSKYMVSFSPNIYKKEFLLSVLNHSESPWQCELASENRVEGNIYSVIYKDCYVNAIIQGDHGKCNYPIQQG